MTKFKNSRQSELEKAGRDYLEVKKGIPCGTNTDRILLQQNNKNRILTALNATEDNWNDWIWQMQYRIISGEQLAMLLPIDRNRIKDIDTVTKKYRFAVSPYYLSLINPADPYDIIARMILPSSEELITDNGILDPSGEELSNPAGAVIRRYPDRVIINITNSCAAFCRHCQRRRAIGTIDCKISANKLEESLSYIRQHTEIRDVLITGGDALCLSDSELDYVLGKLRKINHVEIIRLGSRTLVNLPQRITADLINVLKKYSPIYLNTQFNHPIELTPCSRNAIKKLVDNGIILGNQMVLLKGINDNKFIVRKLNEDLLYCRIRPYYIFHAKNVKGTTHFQSTIEKGVEIIEYLRGNTSGLAIPLFIFSAPNGMGKIPISPNYIDKIDEDKIYLHTWENKKFIIDKTNYNVIK
mgnify:CR=1 FL=1